MSFKEVALKHLRETYDLEGFDFKEDDPLSIRAEFIDAIDSRQSLAYLFDDKVPEILLTGIYGFEAALEDPQIITQILMSGALLDVSSNPFEKLPQIIQPFCSEVFPDKGMDFQVNLGDLIEETDDENWRDDLIDNFSLWLAGRKEFLTDQIWPIALSLESEYEGICLALLKSCFVVSFYNIDKDDDGTYDVDDLWDIFGWSLDLWNDWSPPSKDEDKSSNIQLDVKKVDYDQALANAEGWEDYNEQYFENIE